MARVSDGRNVSISPAPASSSNLGSPSGSLLGLEGVGGHPACTMKENSKPCLPKEDHFAALASILMLVQGFSRFESSTLSLTRSVASIANKDFEQCVDGLAARSAAFPVDQLLTVPAATDKF